MPQLFCIYMEAQFCGAGETLNLGSWINILVSPFEMDEMNF